MGKDLVPRLSVGNGRRLAAPEEEVFLSNV